MREEMKDVVGRDFQVVEQQQMNDALTQYGYPKDAILSPALATTLAKNIQARFLVSSTHGQGAGRPLYASPPGCSGVNDDAGNVVTLAQKQGESPQAFGKRLAEALDPMVKSLPDAKACIDQRTSKPDKAADAANKAIKAVPNHGLAHYCLALMAQDKKAPRGEVVKHLQASAKGDPLSLPVWTALATQYPAGQRYRQHAGGVQADAPGGADQPEAARGAVQVLPPVRASRRRRSRWPTRGSRSIPTTPTCTT